MARPRLADERNEPGFRRRRRAQSWPILARDRLPAISTATHRATFSGRTTTVKPPIWLMDGTSLVAGAAVGPNPGADWHVTAAGDFNGDRKSDILWQHDNGQAAIWLMNGTSLVAGAAVGPNPGAEWHVQGAGQFNGDSQERHPLAARRRPSSRVAHGRRDLAGRGGPSVLTPARIGTSLRDGKCKSHRHGTARSVSCRLAQRRETDWNAVALHHPATLFVRAGR